MEDVPRVQLQLPPRKHTRLRTRTSLLLGFLLFVICSTTVSGLGYSIGTTHYHQDLLLAQKGMRHLLRGKERLLTLGHHALDVSAVAEAQQEFASAVEIFTHIEQDLQFVPGVMSYLPWYGHRLHTALHLVPLALAFSQAGVESCDILNVLIVRFHDPSHGLMATDLPVLTQNVRMIQASLAEAINEADQLHVAEIQDQRVQRLVQMVHNDLPKLQQWLHRVTDIVSIAPVLLGIGTPGNYLVEILDTTELRPGGGFIGNYGILTLSEGRLVSAHITDTDLLDHPFYSSGRGIPFPPAYRWFDIARGNWGLRDSNLSADFPTNARQAESMYEREGGTLPLQGVIAFTPALIQRALVITGPIAIPEYHETVNAQNLIERIHYHQLGPAGEGPDYIASPDGYSSRRKHFVALLAEHFLARMHQLAASNAFQYAQLLADALQTKDMQLYFNNPTAQMLLHNNHLDAAIQTPSGDDLFVVDANIGANKANNLINNTLSDRVTLDAEGNATHHTTLRSAWTIPGSSYGLPLYRDYVRIYMSRGSVLKMQHGWQPRGSSEDFGHEVWAGFFTLTKGQTHTITLTWSVPHVSSHDERGWYYQEMIQRQAGARWTMHVQITLPSCAHAKTVANGGQMVDRQTIVFNQALIKTTPLAAMYTCS